MGSRVVSRFGEEGLIGGAELSALADARVSRQRYLWIWMLPPIKTVGPFA